MQTTAGQSPPFGYLSPPIDGCDALSEDGDTLQTPLTDSEHHQPYAVYQHHHQFSPYTSDSPAVQGHRDLPKPEPAHHPCARYADLLTPHASERLGPTVSTADTYFTDFSSPARALDLANASLEFNPFAASFASVFESRDIFSSTTQPYTPTKNGFNFLHDQQPIFSQPEAPANAHGPPESGPHLSALTSLSVSTDCFDSHLAGLEQQDSLPSLLLAPSDAASQDTTRPPCSRSPISEDVCLTKARMFNPRFPMDHELNPFFARTYTLGDELGAGGYGFVMTAQNRIEGREVAVKFIIKDKVPDHAWWDDELLGRVPTEIMVMSLVHHENIVRCLDLFEDELYFYLVQELHGTPWVSRKRKKAKQITAPGKLLAPSPSMSTPSLTPSPSTDLAEVLPVTPPQVELLSVQNCAEEHLNSHTHFKHQDHPIVVTEVAEYNSKEEAHDPFAASPNPSPQTGEDSPSPVSDISSSEALPSESQTQAYLEPPSELNFRPNFSRRPSYDLFECIEQSKHKRLSENNARYIFAQVVEAVHYLDSQGITHCDIKDENIVVDGDFKVKLIDFGSAVVADPIAPRPFYTLFFGTTAYASSEILRKRPYQAPAAEIWTLGVLLSYLLTGHSPFPTEQDAVDGRIVIRERGGTSRLSRAAVSLMARCLEREPERRADITEVRGHRWLQGAMERGREHEDRS